MGLEESTHDLGATRAFYDRMSRAYDLVTDASEHDLREKGLELLAARPGERVLEVGYGTGHALVELARAVGPDGAVVGVDISEGMRDVAHRRLEREGLGDRVDLRVAPVPPLPCCDGEFDAAFLSFTLELFPSGVMDEVLGEVRRVLREEGRLGVVAMAAPPAGEPDRVLERAYKWFHRHFPHVVDCRPIDVRRVLRESGFRIEDGADLEIWTLRVAAVLARPERASP